MFITLLSCFPRGNRIVLSFVRLLTRKVIEEGGNDKVGTWERMDEIKKKDDEIGREM